MGGVHPEHQLPRCRLYDIQHHELRSAAGRPGMSDLFPAFSFHLYTIKAPMGSASSAAELRLNPCFYMTSFRLSGYGLCAVNEQPLVGLLCGF